MNDALVFVAAGVLMGRATGSSRSSGSHRARGWSFSHPSRDVRGRDRYARYATRGRPCPGAIAVRRIRAVSERRVAKCHTDKRRRRGGRSPARTALSICNTRKQQA